MKQMRSVYPRRCILFAVSFCLLLAGGCGKNSAVDGTYHDSRSSMFTVSLSRGSAEISFAGMTKECTYEVNGNQITLLRSDGRVELVLTRNADGSLTDTKSGNTLVKSD